MTQITCIEADVGDDLCHGLAVDFVGSTKEERERQTERARDREKRDMEVITNLQEDGVNLNMYQESWCFVEFCLFAIQERRVVGQRSECTAPFRTTHEQGIETAMSTSFLHSSHYCPRLQREV